EPGAAVGVRDALERHPEIVDVATRGIEPTEAARVEGWITMVVHGEHDRVLRRQWCVKGDVQHFADMGEDHLAQSIGHGIDRKREQVQGEVVRTIRARYAGDRATPGDDVTQ